MTHAVILTFCLQDYTEFARDLESASEGYQSCHGVKNRPDVNPTPFEEDEFVVYCTSSVNKRFDIWSSLVYLEMMLKSKMQMMQSAVVGGKCLFNIYVF